MLGGMSLKRMTTRRSSGAMCQDALRGSLAVEVRARMTHPRTRPFLGFLLVVAVAAGLALALPAGARAADLQANPGTLTGVFNAAQGGDVIHLAAGDYGTFRGGSKPSMVALVPQPGATATMSVAFNPASYVRLDGLTIDDATLEGATHHVTVANSRFTGSVVIRTNQMANAGVLFDGNTHVGITVCGTCYEGRITLPGSGPSASGVVILHSLFSGGNSDGIQNGSNGTQIIGNEFTNLDQADPNVAHTDPIQLYGSRNSVVRGNYIHDTASGIMSGDGTDHELIEHNVILRTGNSPIILGPDDGSVVRHNTLMGTLRVCAGGSGACNGSAPSSGTVVKDNVVTTLYTNGAPGNPATYAEEDYNLINSRDGGPAAGAHDIIGRPTFVGGATPTRFAGFELAANSKGKGNASDGTDRGANVTGVTVGPGGGVPTPGGGAGPSTPAIDAGPPTLRLLRPLPGAAFTRRLRAAASARDGSGIARVELWLGGRRLGTDRSAPFSWSKRVGRRRRSGTHTLSARAFALDGEVSSDAVTVIHRRRGRSASLRAPSSRRWRLASVPGTNGTVLQGRGPRRHRVTAGLARCSDRRARTLRRLRLRSGRDGKLRATLRTPGLCVVRLG
jgi:Bacterial Ig domain/Right handed beta helix region